MTSASVFLGLNAINQSFDQTSSLRKSELASFSIKFKLQESEVSSAKSLEREVNWHEMSFIYIKKNSGPRTEP